MEGFVGVFVVVGGVCGVLIGVVDWVGVLLVRLFIEVCDGLVMLLVICGCVFFMSGLIGVLGVVVGCIFIVWVLRFFVVLKFCWMVWLNMVV